MVDKTILHLCADTGSDTYPFKENGYNVILVGSEIGVENFTPPENVYGIYANPVCTEFSVVKGFEKHGDYEKGMFLVNECLRVIKQAKPKWWVIENPGSGRLKNFLGEPKYTYEPWWYGSPWTKKTSLWGDFNIPTRKYYKWEDVPKIPELYVRPGRNKPGMTFLHKQAFDLIPEFQHLPKPHNDMEFRSLCSQKFAQAFYEVNK